MSTLRQTPYLVEWHIFIKGEMMPATSREMNVARIESTNNEYWQAAYNLLSGDPIEFATLWHEYERLTGDGLMALFFGRYFPRAAWALSLAMARLNEEAVRRGILPEQKMSPNGKE